MEGLAASRQVIARVVGGAVTDQQQPRGRRETG
jgi:hypothetical protein